MSDFKSFTLNIKTEFKPGDESLKVPADGFIIKGLAVAGHDDEENIDEVKVYINEDTLIDLYSKLFNIDAADLSIRLTPSTNPLVSGEPYTLIEVFLDGES